tara:strand:+ start:419 stop:694 length:276 start_codon:yes stop_codon:yes gene_type:complete
MKNIFRFHIPKENMDQVDKAMLSAQMQVLSDQLLLLIMKDECPANEGMQVVFGLWTKLLSRCEDENIRQVMQNPLFKEWFLRLAEVSGVRQ